MRYHPFGHFGLKVLSIGIAVLLWLTVSGEQVVERGLRIPLEIQNLPAPLEIVEPPPQVVDVRARGPSGTLSRLNPGDLVAVIDLRAARPGQRLFHLTAEQVRAPFGVEVLVVNPSTVSMAFEPSSARVVPVVPSIEGEPAPGFLVGKISSDPATVEVVGPESALKRLREAITEPVTVGGASADVRESVTVGVGDPALRLKTPQSAAVTVQVVPAPVERALAGVPVHLRNVAPDLSAQVVPPVVTVRTRGSRQTLNGLRSDAVNAFVDLAGLGPGLYEGLPVRVDPTRGFGVSDIDPALVQIRIK